MELWLIAVAFGFGFAANAIRLPPMVGYLVAGFVLHAFGEESTASIDAISELGILLLLFGIGLKLKVKTLSQPVVWAGASIHMIVSTFGVAILVYAAGSAGVPLAAGASFAEALLVGFAFSFSSTVFAVKALQQRNEGSSIQGRNAIGILVIQDIFAVIFLTAAVDTLPSIWAIPVVIAVVAARPIYGWLLDRAGHGELLLLFALALALGVGAEAFDAVGIKADLGALLVGFALAKHPRSNELSDSILDLKDVLLVGFFLSIGLDGTPGFVEVIVALAFVLLLPVKTAGFLVLSSRLGFRTRTSWKTAISLATFSEFGLIVAVIGIERGMLDDRWSTTLGIAVATSFLLAAPINTQGARIYDRLAFAFEDLERRIGHSEDDLVEQPGHADVIIFGMGRVGTGAYDELVERHGLTVLGVDRSDDGAARQVGEGRNVIRGDALDGEFWERVSLDPDVRLVVLAMNDHSANVAAVDRLRSFLPNVPIAAIARHPDEVEELREHDVAVARNLYEEAGQGLADDACVVLGLGGPASGPSA